jgi:hypothetical protein
LNQQILGGRDEVDVDQVWDTNTPVVYFIQAGVTGRPIKIGYTDDLGKRIISLQIGLPEPMEVLLSVKGGRELERELHAKFAHLRIRQEWFRAERELLEAILELGKEERPGKRKRGSLHVVKRRRPNKYSYAECKQIARDNGVMTSDHWLVLHRANQLPTGCPWSPRHAYQEEWEGWPTFLGTQSSPATPKATELEKAVPVPGPRPGKVRPRVRPTHEPNFSYEDALKLLEEHGLLEEQL